MKKVIIAAAIQMNSQTDKEANLEQAARSIERAVSLGARLVGLPEMWSFMGPAHLAGEMAEDIPGTAIDHIQRLAHKYKIHIVAGSILERNPASPHKPFNTCCLIGPTGDILAKYRKIHLFDVELPGQLRYVESEQRSSGDEVIVADTGLGRIGLSICYDIRFPELYRRMCDQGCEIVFIPAAFTLQTGRDHWHALLRARAIENQVFVIAPAQIGEKEEGLVCYGRSLIVNPWGTILAQAEDKEGAIIAELNAETLENTRSRLPCLQHRRL